MAGTRWQRFASRAELAADLADAVADRLRAAIAAKGGASLAVSGGTTPGRFFDALSRKDLDWTKVVVTLVDERFVAPTSDRSNERLVRETLLQNEARKARFVALAPREVGAGIPPPRTPPHKGEGIADVSESPSPLWGGVRGRGDNADPVEAAAHQAEAGIARLGPRLDVVVLGMGNDGHTASFFPDAPNLDALTDPSQSRRVMPVHAPSGGEPRLTLTLPLLVDAGYLAFHIEGEAKQAVLEGALAQASPRLPIARVFDAASTPIDTYWAP